ncbi:hypothetical protein GG681_02470 [Epibacterium sp. SM1969]|uniref:Uncharacterized protein n=1 Tax=Tritonibacter aquimaris TaxID=2663379 RepID=A0A844AU84_9RHOB|nr:hypothetical protein [Tritonibacter aquimaris]MQY41492.1 hypothetical protein [Tritonibacter aquimaris]
MRQAKRPKSGALSKGSRGLYALSLIGALLSGILTVALVRYVRFHLTGEGEIGGPVAFLMDAGIAIVACLAIKEIFKLHDAEFKAAQGVGVFLMVMMMHNLAFWAPRMMSAAFSPAWVFQQQQDTVPNSIWIMVQYVEIGPKKPVTPEQTVPQVVYRN